MSEPVTTTSENKPSGEEAEQAAAEQRPSRSRIIAFVVLWLSVTAAILLAPGCYGHNCEGSLEIYGAEAGQGSLFEANKWQSTTQEAPWIFFPRQKYYIFDLHALNGRTPSLIIPYVSANPQPSKGGSDFTIAGGNIALLFNALPNRVDVKNDTCSDYYLRLIVEAPPLPPESSIGVGDAAADSSANLDAGATIDGGDADAGL